MSTHNIPSSTMKKKIILNYPKSAAMGFFFQGLKNEFETAMVNELSVFEPLKFYCISEIGQQCSPSGELIKVISKFHII